jgi:hypothetical protein
MSYKGGCHCGKVAFEVDGDIDQVLECNCSICSKRGYLLWFVPRASLHLSAPESELSAYTFNTHKIKHHFCPVCGVAPFGLGSDGKGNETAAMNVRCFQDVEPSSLKTVQFDGRNA